MSQFIGKTVTIRCQAKENVFVSARETGVVEQVTTGAKEWEQFKVYLMEAPNVVALKSWNNTYVSMREDCKLTLVDAANTWEYFEISPYKCKDGYTIYSPTWQKFWKFAKDGLEIGGEDLPADPTYFLTEVTIVK